MKITLTQDLEKFVAGKVQSGGYADVSEVVRDALRTFRSKDDPAEADSQELAELLLPAVRGLHRPLTSHYFDQLRRRQAQARPRVSLSLQQRDYFGADLRKQVDWYREPVTMEIAERFVDTAQTPLHQLTRPPGMGRPRFAD